MRGERGEGRCCVGCYVGDSCVVARRDEASCY